MLALLLAGLPLRAPVIAPAVPAAAPVIAPPAVASIPGAPLRVQTDARNLPADLASMPELTGQRTANSASFQVDATHATSLLSATPLNYQDANGNWQIIDPAFQTRPTSFVIEQDALKSRVGQHRAWLSTAVGTTGLNWEATTLGSVDAAGTWTTLATANANEPDAYAKPSADWRTLNYPASWSDPSLNEQIISAPNSIEHLLVLQGPPQASLAAEFLELRATLKLLPNSTLWADGKQQTGAFQTSGALEIRDQEGRPALALDPVRAYEQQQDHNATAGVYDLQPGATAGTWTVGLRTPLRWWNDAARQYPAVIDPMMHVLAPTGYGTGMAWVDNANTTGFGKILLGAYNLGNGGPNGSTNTHGYIQFNTMPAMISAPGSNPLVTITDAQLDIGASVYSSPLYDNADADWDILVNQPPTSLKYLGGCPADCGGFTLGNGAPASLTYAGTTMGADVAVFPHYVLTVGPIKPNNTAKIFPWDVTTEIRSWFNKRYDPATPKSFGGPAFSLALDKTCNWFSDFTEDDNWTHVPQCMSLKILPENVRLRISYTAKPLALGTTFFNAPGVPSYVEKAFDLATLDQTTNHQFALAPNSGTVGWRAVAVRTNHALTPATPGSAALRLLDYKNPAAPVVLTTGSTQGKDQTSFALIDDHSQSGIGNAGIDLRAEVIASNQNDFASDPGRNYAIDYKLPQTWTPQNGTWLTQTLSLRSDGLISLAQFNLPAGNTTAVRVTGDPSLDLALVEPTNAGSMADAVVGNNDSHITQLFQPAAQPVRTRTFHNEVGGSWALAVVNQKPPFPTTDRPDFPGTYQVQVAILTCPESSIPSAKYQTCQPIIIPNGVQPQTKQVLGLTIFSPGGFTGGASWCTQNESQGAPVIGATGQAQTNRWIVVGQGTVCWNAVSQTLLTSDDSGVSLTYDLTPASGGATHAGKSPATFVYGDTAIYPLPAQYPTGKTSMTAASNRFEPLATTRRGLLPFEEYWKASVASGSDYLSPSDMQAHGSGVVSVPVSIDAANAPTPTSWAVPWSWYLVPVTANTPQGYTFDVSATQAAPLHSATGFASVASMELRVLDGSSTASGLITTVDSYLTAGGPSIAQFRAANARVTQGAQMGGATLPLQVVVQPPGLPRLPDAQKSCATNSIAISCLDLRQPGVGYQWQNGAGNKNVIPWKLPDIHLDQSPGTVMMQRAGELAIFSKDHPDEATTSSDSTQNFSFDTWDGSVSVKDQPCDPGGPIVSVVQGSANIALPMMGDDGSGGGDAGIKVAFKLCQISLREAKLTFSAPPSGIPVGTTGVGVYLIGGEVLIGPNSTRITIDLGFETTDGGATVGDGHGTVIVDTAGLFDLHANAKLVKIVDADLHLQVAWNPLDILLEAKASCCGNLITGALSLHAWMGQGWQHKYDWLPDNDEFHFTGKIEATLFIPEGYIGDIGITKLPPSDVSLQLRIAFGQFCQDAPCTKYSWGMSASVGIYGVTIGLYVDDTGPALFLGSDDHRLIDEGPVVSVQQSRSTAVQPQFQIDPNKPPIEQPGTNQPYLKPIIKSPVTSWTHEPSSAACKASGPATQQCSFTVKPSAGRALFAAGWMNGALDVSLIKPDGTLITSANAQAEGVTITISNTATVHQVNFGVAPANGQALASGVWKLQLGNVGQGLLPNIKNNYQLMFFSDPPAPTLVLTTPNTPKQVVNGAVTLNWTALRANAQLGDETKIELVYAPISARPLDPTDFTGNAIVGKLKANAGSYVWNTSGLASGEYAIGARIEDHIHGNGPVTAWAVGSILINDTTPPDVPTITGTFDGDDGLIVAWTRPAQRDLAGYQIEYTIPDWNLSNPQRQRIQRVLPRGAAANDLWKTDQARLGGLLGSQQTTVCVRSYDASGNISGCAPFTTAPARNPQPPTAAPIRLRVTPIDANVLGPPVAALKVQWGAPGGLIPAGYVLSFAPTDCRLPNATSVAAQGRSPIDVGNTQVYQLSGLTLGQRYRLTVAAYNGAKLLGPAISATAMNALNFAQWTTVFGLSNGSAQPGADPDKDGLTNQQEYDLGSFPLTADSDGNGFYDGEEWSQLGAVCGPVAPLKHTQPKLLISGLAQLSFTQAVNTGQPKPQRLHLLNFGAADFVWNAQGSAPWITLDQTSGTGFGTLAIGVDARGLAPGHYSGQVTIRSGATSSATRAASDAVGETTTVNVEFDVLPAKQFQISLPLMRR